MDCKADYNGLTGVLPPAEDWHTVHRGIIQRHFDLEITLPDGTKTKSHSGLVDSRWLEVEENWELQLYNRGSGSVPFYVQWYIPASERLCCYDYGKSS